MENIREDLKTLGIVPDTISFTSDYSDKFIEMMDQMINNGFSYADDTPADKVYIYIYIYITPNIDEGGT